MASIRREILIEAPAEDVWAARLEEGARVVTFRNGLVARELIVDVDDQTRRLVWAVVGSPRLTRHNASMQVFAESAAGSSGSPTCCRMRSRTPSAG